VNIREKITDEWCIQLSTELLKSGLELMDDKKAIFLRTGQSSVMQVHALNFVTPNGRFRMIQTVIKSG